MVGVVFAVGVAVGVVVVRGCEMRSILLLLILSTPALGQTVSEAQQAIDDAGAELSNAYAARDELGAAVEDLIDALWECMGIYGVHPGGDVEQDMDAAGAARQTGQNTYDDLEDDLEMVNNTIDDGIPATGDAQDFFDEGSYWSAFQLADSAKNAAISLYNTFTMGSTVITDWTETIRDWIEGPRGGYGL